MENSNTLVGKTVGKYQIVRLLGRGGMAEVYQAYQSNLDRHVALKLMHAFLADDKDFSGRFEREAKNVAALRHPNIIQVYDFDVYNGMPYMVMEFIDGQTLKEHLEDLARKGETLSLAEAVRIIAEVGHALAFAHKRGMIHRDVKPANVMLDASGRVVLTDFGIAKILTGPTYTATGATIGTPAYMSPEQGMGRAGDHRSDIYSLGAMLYQLATGQLPFDADTPLAVMLKHVNDPLPQPRTIRPNIPEGLERIILKSMAKNPDDRFDSVDELVAALSDLDTAAHLAVPASMAGGVSASAQTMSVRPTHTMAMNTPVSAAATQVRPSVPGGATATAPTLATAPSAAKRPLPVLAIAAIAVLAVVIIGGSAFAIGTSLFRPSATPSATVAPTTAPSATTAASLTAAPATETFIPPTETPNVLGTELAILKATQAAQFFTPTPSGTPDLTQTAAACTYDYTLTAQEPPADKTLAVNSKPISKTVTLQNSGTCAFPAGVVFSETTAADGPTAVNIAVPELAPNAASAVAFTWLALKAPGSVTRTFELHLPDGRLIGAALTFTHKYAVFATPTAVRTATSTPAPATATGSVPVLNDLYPADWLGCLYQGQGNMDYNCTVRLGYAGGVGPFTLYVKMGDDLEQRIGFFQPGVPIYYNIISRRCFPQSYNIRLVDDSTTPSTQFSRDLYFDPTSSAGLFPGGACTLP